MVSDKAGIKKAVALIAVIGMMLSGIGITDAHAISSGSCFDFTPEEYGERLNTYLQPRMHASYTVENKSADVIQTAVFESGGKDGTEIPDDSPMEASLLYSKEELSATINSHTSREIEIITAFITPDSNKPNRLTDICLSMIRAADESVSESQALEILKKAQAAGTDGVCNYNGHGYQFMEQRDGYPYYFVVYAEERTGVAAFSEMEGLPAGGSAVDDNGYSVTLGEFCELLTMLLSDSQSDFYIDSNCSVGKPDPESGIRDIAVAGNSFMILPNAVGNEYADPVIDDSGKIDAIILVAMLSDQVGQDAFAKITGAILYLTRFDIKGYDDAYRVLDQLAGKPEEWIRSGAMRHMLGTPGGGLFMFSSQVTAEFERIGK